MSVGSRIKEERERLGFSQEVFAERGGVSRRSQIMYEQDKTEASATYFTLIAELGADVNYILTGKNKGLMLKANFAVNDSLSLSREEIEMLEMFRAVSSEQKNDALESLGKFKRHNEAFVREMMQRQDYQARQQTA